MTSCTVDGLIEFLGCHLKDEDHVRWKVDYLTYVIGIAASQLQADRRDLFKEDKKIKLEPGCYTKTCMQGCEDITGPFRNFGEECEDIEDLNAESDWISEYFPNITCEDDDDGDYLVERVLTYVEDPCTIKVDPPVPDDGKSYFLVVKCQQDISEDIESGNLPSGICKHLNAFIQLVLFYTYGMDSMVNLDETQAMSYFKNYIDLIGLSFLHDLSHRERMIVLRERLDFAQKIGV